MNVRKIASYVRFKHVPSNVGSHSNKYLLRISNLSMKLQRNLTFLIIFTTFIGKMILAEMGYKFVCPSGFHSHGSDKCLRQDFILFVGS